MRRIVLTLLQDTVLILAIVGFVTLAAAGIGYATGEVERNWVRGEFRLADGRVVTAETEEEVEAVLENPGSEIREAVLTSGVPKGLPFVIRASVLSFFAALGGVAVWRGRGRLPMSATRLRSIGRGAVCGFGMSAFGWAYGSAVSILGGPQVDWRAVFEEALGRTAALSGTTALFAVLHGAFVYLPAYLALGAVLGYLRSRWNDLVAPVTAHMVTNAIALGLVYGTN